MIRTVWPWGDRSFWAAYMLNRNLVLKDIRMLMRSYARMRFGYDRMTRKDQLPLPVKIRSVLVPTGFQLES